MGLAGGANLPASVIPFLLCAVNLLGIDSVMKPYPDRIKAWNQIAAVLPLNKLDAITSEVPLSGVPALGEAILKGGVKGRMVVDVRS